MTATIAINGTVPAGGIAGKVVFGTTSPDTAVQLPSGLVSINSNPFVITIPTRAVATQRTVGIRVSTDPNAEPSDQVSANLVLRPPALTSLAVNRPVVTGGEKPRGVARLDTGAPAAAAIQVSLTSSDPTTATVPPSVVMTGDSAVFTVTTSIVPTDRPVTITASAGGQTRSVTLTVKAPVLVRVNVLPDSIIPGVNQATASLAISGDFANPQTVSVSCDAALVCPSSVAIPAGRPKVEFPVSASPVPAKITVPLSVTLNGVTQSASVRLKPLTLESIVVSPDTVNAGVSTSLTIELNAPVPSGQSLTVSFTSSDPSIVPAPSLISFQGGDLVKLRNVTTLSPQSQLRTVTLTATLTQPTSSGQNVSSEPVRITVRP